MQQILSSDRQSMLEEIRTLRGDVTAAKEEKEEENARRLAEFRAVQENAETRAKNLQKKRKTFC